VRALRYAWIDRAYAQRCHQSSVNPENRSAGTA
jgi:hypothetical protein